MPFLPLFCTRHKDWCFHHNVEIRNTKAKEMPFSCFELECGIEKNEKEGKFLEFTYIFLKRLFSHCKGASESTLWIGKK